MMSTLLSVISTNKGIIIKRALIGAGALAGLTLVGKLFGNKEEPDMMDDDVIDGDYNEMDSNVEITEI